MKDDRKPELPPRKKMSVHPAMLEQASRPIGSRGPEADGSVCLDDLLYPPKPPAAI
jgi:hypothetical protein